MYNEVHDKVLEGIMSVALTQIMYEEDEACPSDEELAKMYPLSKKMLRKYNKRIKEREYRNPLPVVYLKRVSIIVLAVISVMFGVLSTSGEVRAAIANTVVTWYDKYVQIDFSNSKTSENSENISESNTAYKTLDKLVIGYIPDGFEVTSSTEEQYLREYFYINDNGDYLIVGINTTNGTDIGMDIEYSDFEQVTIGDLDGYFSYKDTDRMGTLVFGNTNYTVTITGLLEKDIFLKIAANIK